MDRQDERRDDSRGCALLAGYDPPRVERVLSAGELEREILYAGAVQTFR